MFTEPEAPPAGVAPAGGITYQYDAVVVGAGPNGLAAAITLAQAGRSVLVLEAAATAGGGMRSAELTLPGFTHDLCSAIHPMALASPFFRKLPLSAHGLEWIHPAAPFAHPLDDGSAAVLERSVEATAKTLGVDSTAYVRLMTPLVESFETLMGEVLKPLRMPAHPLLMARFGLQAMRSARGLARSRFSAPHARALFAGVAAHSQCPLGELLTASFGLVLAAAGHAVGWPMPKGGSQRIADAMASYLRMLGGEVRTGHNVESVDELPRSRAVLLDVGPAQLLKLAGHRLSGGYKRQLERYRYGPGVFKLDYALEGPIPWKATACERAGTVHLGGTLEEIVASEQQVGEGSAPEQPYVLVVQQSRFDSTRAPPGKHTVWAYCHVPHGAPGDMTQRIEDQLERFAPGFRDRVLLRRSFSPAQLEAYNANYVGGDISAGYPGGMQLFARPALRLKPYATSDESLFLCSASTPPGPGVHGMCGHLAALAALKTRLNQRPVRSR